MRFTKRDLEAIADALNQVLAGEVLDGYADGSEEEQNMREAMEAVKRKVDARRGQGGGR